MEHLEHLIGLVEHVLHNQEKLMSKVTDDFAAINASLASIQTGITNLDNQIQAFQNSPGTLSAADQASLDAIVASSAQLATAANAVVPVVPPAGS